MVRKSIKGAFTVFFIPVIPLYARKKDLCLSCGNEFSTTKFVRDLTKEFLERDLHELPALLTPQPTMFIAKRKSKATNL